MSSYEEAFKSSIDDKIYCHCVFEFKDDLKKLGFVWVPALKKWMISKNKFNEDIYNKSQKVRYSKQTSIGIHNYFYVHYISKFDRETNEIIINFNKNKEYLRKKDIKINKDVKNLNEDEFLDE
jgi:hypothetical protein